MSTMNKECNLNVNNTERETQCFWYVANIIILCIVLVLSISTYNKVKHFDHSCSGTDGVHHSGSLTFSNGVQLHMFLDQSAVAPIVISVVETPGNGMEFHHWIALTTRRVIDPSLVEFAIAPNSFCTETVAIVDLRTMQLLICGKVITSNTLSNSLTQRRRSLYGPTAAQYWKEAAIAIDTSQLDKTEPCKHDTAYTTCISERTCTQQ